MISNGRGGNPLRGWERKEARRKEIGRQDRKEVDAETLCLKSLRQLPNSKSKMEVLK